MHIVYRAENLFDAHLVRDALERAEIPAFISGEYLIGAVGQLPARDYMTVSVPETCLPEAETIVRQIEAMLVEAREALASMDDAADGMTPAAC
ncbi:DUF2007 domain-containing protein [Dyella sp. A6]|uniref:putative signal transducing protein n=1 Tax=Dyella aluminiiresistens TaxID=3069105 RepID=UPI002E78D955|nr:DUF2007 domain-containing protein [Dyella sp. A6]